MAEQRPKAASTIMLGRPVHRVFGAETVKGFMRNPIPKAVVVGDVEMAIIDQIRVHEGAPLNTVIARCAKVSPCAS